jgi:hypothetical protein
MLRLWGFSSYIVGFWFLRIPSLASPPRRAHDMFHLFGLQNNPKKQVFTVCLTICITICLFSSPDYVSRYVCETVCFTVCLFVGPDLDGYRASLTLARPKTGPKTQIRSRSTARASRYVSRYVCSKFVCLLVKHVSRYVCLLVRT